jgi:hypothetical protein
LYLSGEVLLDHKAIPASHNSAHSFASPLTYGRKREIEHNKNIVPVEK